MDSDDKLTIGIDFSGKGKRCLLDIIWFMPYLMWFPDYIRYLLDLNKSFNF